MIVKLVILYNNPKPPVDSPDIVIRSGEKGSQK